MNLEGITKIYKLKNEEIVALDNISVNFLKGKFYAIMGHSGSGKSTLIKIMGLMDKPTKGKYTIGNINVLDLNDDELSLMRMKHLGFIFQEFFLEDNLKAYENVMIPMLINKDIKKEDRYNKAIELLKMVGLEQRINHFPLEVLPFSISPLFQ